MKIFKNNNITESYKNSVLAVGNFDGVHLGHKKVLNEAYKKAKKNKIKFGLLTFPANKTFLHLLSLSILIILPN